MLGTASVVIEVDVEVEEETAGVEGEVTETWIMEEGEVLIAEVHDIRDLHQVGTLETEYPSGELQENPIDMCPVVVEDRDGTMIGGDPLHPSQDLLL